MTEREKLLKRVQMFDFILVELNLFLDTHPDSEQALDYFEQYNYLKNQAVMQYQNKYGPLRAEDQSGTETFSWVKGPWPWESEAEK